MKRAIIAVLALVASTLGVIGATVSPAYAVECSGPHYASDYDYVTMRISTAPDPSWRVMHELKYRNCTAPGERRWADPLSLKIGCREHDGAHWAAQLHSVGFNPRIWDRDHHEVNPGLQRMECNSGTWNTKILNFDAMSKFHRCAEGGPRVETHVEFAVPWAVNPSTRLSSAFWGFTGPVAITC